MQFKRPEEAAIWCSFAEKALAGALASKLRASWDDAEIVESSADFADGLLEQYRARRSTTGYGQ